MNARRRRLLDASSGGIVALDHRGEPVTVRAHVRMIENTLDDLERRALERDARRARAHARRHRRETVLA